MQKSDQGGRIQSNGFNEFRIFFGHILEKTNFWKYLYCILSIFNYLWQIKSTAAWEVRIGEGLRWPYTELWRGGEEKDSLLQAYSLLVTNKDDRYLRD